ncbi:MAG TPA: SLC13 family permease [Candidatus Acidoferrum sp.]|nr:SLC13 family permease [Candidatus Acidoferrum sp.]
MALQSGLAIVISLIAVIGMVFRPQRSQEWMWAAGAALLLLLLRILSPGQALAAVLRGDDVYAFLIGIMALAELARHEGLFDWLATHALDAGHGSQHRLFALVYLVGALVTALLSNDTTAVVLTPAISAALARTDASPLPYLFGCAFIANAASFVLPISNPANLVVFGPHLPALHVWLAAFGLSALSALACTYVGLRFFFRVKLRSPYDISAQPRSLPPAVALSGVAIALAAIALIVAAALRIDVGITALVAAIGCLAIVSLRERSAALFVARHLAWQIVPLVAGLFVIVAALDRAGVLDVLRNLFQHGAPLVVAFAIAVASNLFNNLPVALATGFALQSAPVTPAVAHAALVAVDLGPNVAVTGSLATMLWLIALRRDGFNVSAWHFFRIGVAITIPALILSVFLVR